MKYYIALFDINDRELKFPSYDRIEITKENFKRYSDGNIKNFNEVSFPKTKEEWGLISSIKIMNSDGVVLGESEYRLCLSAKDLLLVFSPLEATISETIFIDKQFIDNLKEDIKNV